MHRLITVIVCGLRERLVEIYQDMKGSHHLDHFQVKTFFSAPLLTTHLPNNLYSITYHENNVIVQSEHTQSLHMNIR